MIQFNLDLLVFFITESNLLFRKDCMIVYCYMATTVLFLSLLEMVSSFFYLLSYW